MVGCLTVGAVGARMLSSVFGKQLYGIHHMVGPAYLPNPSSKP